MGIGLRYCRSREEAQEVMNDGFVKMFNSLGTFKPGYSFKYWLRRIMINSAIDHFRRNERHYNTLEISHIQQRAEDESVLEQMSAKEIISHVQRLPASYRMVFNLYVIEGYKHEEIAAILNISVGTSKSNLSIARSKLRIMLGGRESDTKNLKRNG